MLETESVSRRRRLACAPQVLEGVNDQALRPQMAGRHGAVMPSVPGLMRTGLSG